MGMRADVALDALLAEVERAAKLVREIALGNKIADIETAEDNIVYSGESHTEFVRRTSRQVAERLSSHWLSIGKHRQRSTRYKCR